MTTIREWLDEIEFDWGSGRIVVQFSDDDQEFAEMIPHDHPILDTWFDEGYGVAGAPKFIAEDKNGYYFADNYDGMQSVCFIYRDIAKYLDVANHPIIVPGGG